MRPRRGGSASVELALGLPVLLALLLGVMDWSWMAMHQLTVVGAAARGARLAAGLDMDEGPAELAREEAQAWLDAHALASVDAVIDVRPGEVAGGTGPVVTVVVTVPLAPLIGLTPVPGTLRGESSVAWYGRPEAP